MLRRNLLVVAACAALFSGVGIASASLAATTTTATTATTSPVIHGCVSTTTRVFTEAPGARHLLPCPAGTVAVNWNATGPQGPQGIQGAQGAQGIQGPQGPAGTNGTNATLTVSAQTVLSNWPEGSGWAHDNFNRNVTITREHAAPASDCGAAATQCWFYTETLADNGTFTTVNGHASPNTHFADLIQGAWVGSIVGGGKLEFYADSASPNPGLVPGTATGGSHSTTNWYKLFFPNTVNFGLTSGVNTPWTTYDWNYQVTATCGTNASVSESWNDGINPGDDGQGALDGNITGATACP